MKSYLSLFYLFLVVLVSTNSSSARTWYIKPDGSGDAPTIRAGVDSSSAGDTVLVAAGQYELNEDATIFLKNGIVVISEDGPVYTILLGIPSPSWPVRAFYGNHLSEDQQINEISGFWFKNFDYAIMLDGGYAYVRYNIFTENKTGIALGFTNFVTIENNTFYNNMNYAIDASNRGNGGTLLWNIIWDRSKELDATFTLANDFMVLNDAWPYHANNFSLDPQFCGPTDSNLLLQSDSPCAPNNPPYSIDQLIGALPVGCGLVETRNKSLGAIKSMFNK